MGKGDNVKNSLLLEDREIHLNGNTPRQKVKDRFSCYEIMHGEKRVEEVNTRGEADILNEKFLSYDLFLECERDLDTLINNLTNFNHWCASRVLSLERKYAKEILNSIGMAQAVTDQDRAKISLSYHCLSLTDIYWIKERNEEVSYENINLYDNLLNEAIVELSLRGRPMTVTNQELAPDLSTS